MAETPLTKKLGMKPGQRIAILNAPEGYRDLLGTPPEDVELTTTLEGTFDMVHLFVKEKAELDTYALRVIHAVKPGGLLWIAYPKQSAKVPTDITRDKGWDVVTEAGWRPVTQIAIDEVWSALRFRPGE
jgi:hypothetical protein